MKIYEGFVVRKYNWLFKRKGFNLYNGCCVYRTILNNFLSSFTNSIIIPLIGLIIPESWNVSDSIIDKLQELVLQK